MAAEEKVERPVGEEMWGEEGEGGVEVVGGGRDGGEGLEGFGGSVDGDEEGEGGGVGGEGLEGGVEGGGGGDAGLHRKWSGREGGMLRQAMDLLCFVGACL